MIEVQEGTPEVGDCVEYGYFRWSVEGLKRRDVLGGGVDCQVEECLKTSQTGNPAEEDYKSGGNAQTGLLFTV